MNCHTVDNSHNLNGKQCVNTNNTSEQQHRNFVLKMLKFPLNLNKQINPFRNVPALVSQQIQIRNRYDGKANRECNDRKTYSTYGICSHVLRIFYLQQKHKHCQHFKMR